MEQTNREFAAFDDAFKRSCEQNGIKPTARQASKWRNRKGSAWNKRGILGVKAVK